MNELFAREWRLYRRAAPRAPFAGEPPAGEAEFDAPVRVGEIRVFADANRPLVALVLEDRGLSGYRVVPVSPFTVPASGRELVVGDRVLQLWNATVASRRFVARSWLVDTVAPEALEEVRAALPAAAPGRVVAGDGIQARYEREFLVTGGGFVPFAVRRADVGAFPMRAGWLLAASLLVCVGGFYLLIGGGREGLRRWSEGHVRALCAAKDPEIELLGGDEELPPDPALTAPEPDVSKDIAVAVEAPAMPSPVPSGADGRGGSAARQLSDAAAVRRLEGSFAAHRRSAFVRPSRVRTATLPLSPDPERLRRLSAPAPAAASGYASAPRGETAADGAPLVECLVANCPWDASRRLVQVRVLRPPAGAGASVEVEFMPEEVQRYRRLEAPAGSDSAFFEVVPDPAAPEGARFCRAHTVWATECGTRSVPAGVRLTTPAELGRVEPPADDGREATATDSDDVPVDVKFRRN